MEEKFLTFTDETGEIKKVEVIAYFTLAYNNKDYVVYTENKADNNGNVEVLVSEVIEEGDNVSLVGIEDDNVWSEIKKVLVEMAKDGDK